MRRNMKTCTIKLHQTLAILMIMFFGFPSTCSLLQNVKAVKPTSTFLTLYNNGDLTFEELFNCRDIAWTVKELQAAKLIRCGEPSRASSEDLSRFYKTLGVRKIKTVIDLRTEEEVLKEKQTSVQQYQLNRLHLDTLGEDFGSVVHIPLGDRTIIGKEIMRNAQFSAIMNYLYTRFVLKQPEEANMILVPFLNGLTGFNIISLKNEQEKIFQILKHIAIPWHHPILFHCTAGKDRTGLISYLVLSTLGVSIDDILQDYMHSNLYSSVIKRRAMQSIFTKKEEKPDDDFSNEFTRAHKAVIDGTHSFLLSEYGSVELYLDTIGFDYAWRQRLKRTLLLSKTKTKPSSENIFYVL